MASPHLESLSAVSSWPLHWVRLLKDFTYDLGSLAVLSLFVQWLIPNLGFRRRVLLLLPTLLMFVLGARGMPELWSSWMHRWADSLERGLCAHAPRWVVVLGGGLAGADEMALSSWSRVRHAARFIQSQPTDVRRGITLIMSGGLSHSKQAAPESSLMKAAVLALLPSFSEERVIEENTSLNTHDNAVHVARILHSWEGKEKKEGVVLVTNKLHMPRALGSFAAAGLKVCPAPASDVEIQSDGFMNFRNADRTVRVLNEYAGFLGYQLNGWIQ